MAALRHNLTGFVLLAAMTVAGAAGAGQLDLSLGQGRVTLIATEVSLSEILAEWSRLGDTRFVYDDEFDDQLTGPPLTLHLVDVPEAEVLRILLRSAPGYVAAPRAAHLQGAAVYDRVVILSSGSRPRTARAAPVRVSPPVPATSPPPDTVETTLADRATPAEPPPARASSERPPPPPQVFSQEGLAQIQALMRQQALAESALAQRGAVESPSVLTVESATTSRPGTVAPGADTARGGQPAVPGEVSRLPEAGAVRGSTGARAAQGPSARASSAQVAAGAQTSSQPGAIVPDPSEVVSPGHSPSADSGSPSSPE